MKSRRRNLVTRRDCFFGGQSVYWHSTEYDLLNRPTNATDSVSLVREWLYNRRSELAAATVGTDSFGYAYDSIGNRIWSAANAVTNSYTANSLNQYVSVGRDGDVAPQTPLHYDADGNMTGDGTFSYAYDAENRLVSATSAMETDGAIRVLNAYDHRSRRIRKTVRRLHSILAPSSPAGVHEWETQETHTFVWDGSNIVLEKVEFANGTTRTFECFWGADKSGSEQGAGGVGGLLAVSVDGVFHVPCYDHNGNVVLYVSETGSVAAQYVYDPYGNIVETYGDLASRFHFGFSTQYHDRETGMVAYQRRFYRPDLGRWLNRDPIEEDGGENLYAFCGNNPISEFDILGTSTCCRNGRKENCDNFYKWEGTAQTSSATWGVGVTFLIVDIKSNFVCMTCSRWRIHFKAVLLTASWGAAVSLTGSDVRFGNVPPDAFVGSIGLISAGAGVMGVAEASSLWIGDARTGSAGLVGGAEFSVGGAYGWFVDFEMAEE